MTTGPKLGDIRVRLTAVKLMVAGLKDAMPTAAREMRREACEDIDEVIDDLLKIEFGRG